MINIVLEGPKSSGKSTISDHFAKKGFKYFHSSSETDNDLNYHMELLFQNKRIFKGLECENRVIDRFSVGEMIYPSIYQRKGKLDWNAFAYTMSSINTIYVILYSSDINLLINRINKRGRNTEDEQIEYIKKSNEMFEFIGKNFNNENILVLDVAKHSTKEIIEKIEERFYK